jgi:hypothetical protein
MIRRCCIPGVLLAAAAAAAVTAAPPTPITRLAGVARLGEREHQQIQDWADHWCQELLADDPSVVDTARERLTDPLLKPVRVGEPFRFAYAEATLSHLEGTIENGSSQAAVSAMQIAAMLGTPRALETILRHCSIEDEQEFGLRLWAAKSFPIAVGEEVLPITEIDKALRRFGDAASREQNWLVLRRQFEAIASVKSILAREEQVRVLRSATDRMEEQPGPSDLMQAAYPAVKLMLDEYLKLQPEQQEAFGKSLAPVLCDLCTVANKHWDGAQEDDVARVSYGGAVHISENLLFLIDGRVRPRQAGPRTELGPAWRNREKNRFTSDHAAWQAVLSRPPYRN